MSAAPLGKIIKKWSQIKFDRDNFNLEVETSSYAEIENLINLISSMGVESRAGASRRLNNKILGEINVQQF